MKELLTMYDEVDEVNKILCLPSKYWTDEQRKLVQAHVGGAYGLYYTPEEEEEFYEDKCDHEWEEQALLISTVTVCSKCGEKKEDI